MIREATVQDVPRIVELGGQFLSHSEYAPRLSHNPEQMANLVAWLLESEHGAVFVAEDAGEVVGMIAMAAYPHPMSGEPIAGELAWFVQPESRGRHGLRLLKAAEDWAREVGAAKLQMIAPNERVGHLYQRLGFEAIETNYQKDLRRIA